MNKPIVAKFQWTVDEFMRANEAQMFYTSAGRRVGRGTFIVAPIAAAIAIVILLTRGIHPLHCL